MRLFQALFKPVKRRGYALVIVLVFTAVGLLVLASFLARTSTNATLTQRNNEYFNSVEASEAATEKVISELTSDFLSQGAGTVNGNASIYRASKPNASENARWNHFLFKDTHGNKNATEVDVISPWTKGVPLISQYQGLSGDAETYRITSQAQDLNGGMTAAVQQDVQLANVSVFQFAIFYNLDLEMCPGANMIVSGRVHSNNNIYLQPDGSHLTFSNDVTSAENIIAGESPNDPSIRSQGTITFDGAHDSGVDSLNLPIGTNNSPAAVDAILQIPPNNESPNSQMGQQRLYNKADLIILVTDSGITVHGGVANGNGPNLQPKDYSSFVTNVSFYNVREGKTVKATQIDIGNLAAFNSTKNPLTQALGRDIESVYVADLRTQTGSTEPAVRLVDGQTLPPSGLTVATPDPLYVYGNYNVVSSAFGTSDTSQSRPAALIGDSINVLSGNWSDGNSTKALSSRNATDTTVNAAFLGGIVPSGNGYYSGGVENFPRFLENWSGHTFTYNGSMVVMFPSQIATAPWKGTGSTYNVYNAPTRNWNFDVNFNNPNKLPPIGPAVRVIIRGNWKTIPPS